MNERQHLDRLKETADELQNMGKLHKKFISREKERYTYANQQIDQQLKNCQFQLMNSEKDIKVLEILEYQHSLQYDNQSDYFNGGNSGSVKEKGRKLSTGCVYNQMHFVPKSNLKFAKTPGMRGYTQVHKSEKIGRSRNGSGLRDRNHTQKANQLNSKDSLEFQSSGTISEKRSKLM